MQRSRLKRDDLAGDHPTHISMTDIHIHTGYYVDMWRGTKHAL